MGNFLGKLLSARVRLIVPAVVFFLLGVGTVCIFMQQTTKVQAANHNDYISFQGKITNPNGTNVADGNYDITFKLYNVSSGGVALWTESWTGANQVAVTSGVFQVELGSVNTALASVDFNGNPNLYLGITFNNDAQGEMSPRIPLNSVPFAQNSNKVGGLSSSQLGQLAASQSYTGSNTFQSSTDAPGIIVKQTAAGSPAADIFSIQGSNGTSKFLQITSTAANQGTVTLQTFGGSNTLTLDSAAAILVGPSATSVTIGNTSGAVSQTLSLGTNATSGATNVVHIGDAATATDTVSIGSASNTASATNIQGGTTGGINIGSVLSTTTGSAIHIADTNNGTGTQNVTIGSTANAANTVALQGKVTATTANNFQIQNTTTDSILNVDVTSDNSNNLVTNPSFETNTTNWSQKGGTQIAPSRVITNAYFGNASLSVLTTATTNDGVKFTTGAAWLSPSTRYTMSLYARTTTTNFSTFEIGRSDTGSDISCLTAQTVVSSGWTRFSCSFTTGASVTNSYIYAKQTDAVIRTFLIDAVTLETDANATTQYHEAEISLGGTFVTPVIVQPTENSSNALQIQNANGTAIFTIDTTDTNLINNPGVETNISGWAGKGAAGIAIARDTTPGNAYMGAAGLKVVTTALAQDGVKFTYANTLLTNTQWYALSFYAKLSAGSIATLTYGRADNGVAETNCVTTGTLTTTWTRFSCTFQAGAQSGSPYIFISQGTTASIQTFYVDGVALEPVAGSTSLPSAYGAGAVSINGVVTSAVSFQNKSDSSAAFQVQNSSGLALLNVNTSSNKIQVGSQTTDTNEVDLALDSFSTYTDAGTCSATASGGIYYNTASNAIRACIGGAWEDLTSTGGLGLLIFGVVPDSGNATTPGDLLSLTGPCKAAVTANTNPNFTVTVSPCIAYSGGRKVTVSSTALNIPLSGANIWMHICLTGTSGAPALTTAAATESANQPAFSVNNPVLCLADVKVSAAAITNVYDVRTFTTTQKEFATFNSTVAGTPTPVLGAIAINSTTAGQITNIATAGTAGIRGVVVATSGANGASVNSIIAVSGQQWVKNGATGAVNAALGTSGTANYAQSGATAGNYTWLGTSERAVDAACAVGTCQFSELTSIHIR